MAALSDPIRVGLVRVLADGRERGWGELRAPVAKSTLSHHLRVLRDAGTDPHPPGRHPLLRDPPADRLAGPLPGLLQAVLAAAEDEDVGHQVTVQPGPQRA